VLKLIQNTTDEQNKSVKKSRSPWNQCAVWLCVTGAESDTTTPVLLLVYEFEVKVRLGDPDAERVLDRAMCLPQAEPKLFEAIAGNSIFICA